MILKPKHEIQTTTLSRKKIPKTHNTLNATSKYFYKSWKLKYEF